MTRGSVREHTGLSMGIAASVAAFFVIMPALIAVAVYMFLTVYAIVKAVGSAPKQASPLTVLVGVAIIVATFATLLGGAIALLGRAMNPRKRARR
ncbi:MAG: hypothetical protein M3O98_04445 [Actinomycetota bacterium]|nr:hypothetical protein [Actinomycetota bacterium]